MSNKVYRIAFKNTHTGMIHKGNVTFNTETEAENHCKELNDLAFDTLKALGEYVYIKE